MENKVKQQRLIVLFALYILRKNNYSHPTKRQVLNLVRLRNWMNVPEFEAEKRHLHDHDEIWENDLCFRRKDLVMERLVGDELYGCWNISRAGVSHIEERSEKWLKFEDPDRRRDLTDNLKYVTEDLLKWMLKVAKGQDLSLRTNSSQREAS